jgi:hypothetical protein
MAEREGLLAAAPLVLRFAPDRRSCAATSKIAFGDFVEPPFLYLGFESPASWLPRLSDRNRRELIGRVAEREGFEPSMGF